MSQRTKQALRRWAGILLGRRAPGVRNSRQVEGIPGRVHLADTMFDPSEPCGIEYYLRAGRSAVDVILGTLEEAGVAPCEIDRLLDYGCGYGRVLRHLPDAFPDASYVACDLDARAVAFCAEEFGATAVVAPLQPSRLKLPPCDLIWGGSVWTHLPEAECRELFVSLSRSLEPGGLLIFSFHGAFAADNLHSLFGGAFAEDAEIIRGEIQNEGMAYRPYSEAYLTLGEGSYGTSWHHPDFFRRLADGSPGLQEVRFAPQGWDAFHDVIALRREPREL
jgi:SAM-dependent methyltransferase